MDTGLPRSDGALPPPARPVRVAVIGSGIAGLAAARTLNTLADLTLYEAGGHFGGHAHTVPVTLPDTRGSPIQFGVDTGFLSLDERASPNLMSLLASLEVPLAKAELTFSVQAGGAAAGGGTLEWSGSELSSVFAQRRNLASPRFLRMLADVARFHRIATRLAREDGAGGEDGPLLQSVSDFLRAHRFSREFLDGYFLPLLGGIWSCPADPALDFPLACVVRFCHHHGLLQITGRPQGYTVAGGARRYVDKIVEPFADRRLDSPVLQVLRDAQGVRIVTEDRVERFDAVVVACHSDQALRLLGSEASPLEQAVLGAIRYQPSRAVLHTDASVLPASRRAWAAWNWERAAGARACLHALINRLQPLPVTQPVVVSLDPQREIAPAQVLGEYTHEHPVFDLAAIRAQARVADLQGQRHTWFAGAWTGDGFHEDGLKSGLRAARAVIDRYGLAPTESPGHALRHALPGVFG